MSRISNESVQQMLRIERYRKFEIYDEVVDLGIETKWKELCSKITDPDVDPVEVLSEDVEDLQHIKYSLKLMNICCLCETWEQDLYNFLKEKGLITVFSNNYKNNTQMVFNRVYPTCATSNYPKIEEMRYLVNAIKHGEGGSFANIRRITSDAILADSNIGVIDEDGTIRRIKQIEFDCNTLTSKTLKVDGKLQLYIDTIVDFWKNVYAVENGNSDESELE